MKLSFVDISANFNRTSISILYIGPLGRINIYAHSATSATYDRTCTLYCRNCKLIVTQVDRWMHKRNWRQWKNQYLTLDIRKIYTVTRVPLFRNEYCPLKFAPWQPAKWYMEVKFVFEENNAFKCFFFLPTPSPRFQIYFWAQSTRLF